MLFRDRGYHRGVELGPYPLDALEVDPDSFAATSASSADSPLRSAVQKYSEIFAGCSTAAPAPRAPVPDDLQRRAKEIKGAAYYLDAAHVGGAGPGVAAPRRDL